MSRQSERISATILFAAILAASATRLRSQSDSRELAPGPPIERQIQSLTAQRNTLAAEIRTGLNDAQFNSVKLSENQIKAWTSAAQDIINASAALAASSS